MQLPAPTPLDGPDAVPPGGGGAALVQLDRDLSLVLPRPDELGRRLAPAQGVRPKGKSK